MEITVFTPTYNRGYIIGNLYKSLRQQTYSNFEWLIIDDGSTDNTEELFSNWMKEDNHFKIIYKKVENGGKHRAINKAVNTASGRLFFIVDSDDYLTENALLRILEVEKSIPQNEKKNYCGVCGDRGHSTQESLGKTFDGEYLDITSLERSHYGITGDKAEAFYTDILRKYPFPEYEGEKFITECVVWNKMASDGYKIRFFNEIIYICDYLSDGLTKKGKDVFYKNPLGWGDYITQAVMYGEISGLPKWNVYLEYYNHNKKSFSIFKIAKLLKVNPVTFCIRMMGMLLFYKIYQ